MSTEYDYLSCLSLTPDTAPVNSCSAVSYTIERAAGTIKPPPLEKTNIVIMPTKEKQKPPMPECIMERDKKGAHFTTVKWDDGTYTTVKASQDDEGERSSYMAFCAALTKKLYGSNSAVHRVVNRHTETYLTAEKKKADAAKRAKEAARIQAEHERKLLREAARLRLKDEAKAYNSAHRYVED